jgi:hypothetical protein
MSTKTKTKLRKTGVATRAAEAILAQTNTSSGWEPRARELVKAGRLKAALELIPHALQPQWENDLMMRVAQQPDDLVDLEGLTRLSLERGWLNLAYAASGAGLASPDGPRDSFLCMRACTLVRSDPERAQLVFEAAYSLAERAQATRRLHGLAFQFKLHVPVSTMSEALARETLSDEIAMTEFPELDEPAGPPLPADLVERLRAKLSPLGIHVL